MENMRYGDGILMGVEGDGAENNGVKKIIIILLLDGDYYYRMWIDWDVEWLGLTIENNVVMMFTIAYLPPLLELRPSNPQSVQPHKHHHI